MVENLLPDEVDRYLHELASVDDEPVLLEMEALAEDSGFPIIGRICGQFLEVAARAVQARRVFELGSGFGYSAYWFSRATGPDGEIHLTDTDPANEKKAADFLGRASLGGPIRYHVGDALEALDEVEGEFDVIFCDINKHAYPEAWKRARSRIRVGGLYMCDNVLWGGRVAGINDEDDDRPEWKEGVVEQNRLIASDPDFRSFINPARDGVVAAIRIR